MLKFTMRQKDDVVSSGTTLKNASLAIKKIGAYPISFFSVAGKTNLIGKKYEDILKKYRNTFKNYDSDQNY